jgi:hypothetical protein
MAQQRRRRNVVACGNCGANYDARGEDPRCPACDARLAEYEPGVPRPALRGYTVTDLEGPDNLRSAQEPETAPIEDFIAAALVLLSFVVMVIAVMSRSPALLQVGMAIFAVTGIGFGLIKLRKFLKHGRQRPKGSFDEAPSMFDWLIGRGFWDRFR